MQPGDLQTANALTPPVAAEPPIPAKPNRLLWFFWGTDGLRSFWRLVIFILLCFGLRFGVSRILHLLHLVRPHNGNIEFTAKFVLVQDGLAFLCVLVATLIMGRFEKRSLGDYGLPMRSAFGLRFWEGVVWGFVAECATMFTLYLTGNATFDGYSLTGLAALQVGLLWALAFVLVGFFEESLFRGYPQFTLAQGIGFWPAAFLLSGLFWLGHMQNQGETWIGGLATCLAALLFCVSLKLTGNLWFAIGMHAAWDWGETYFFGVADSGMAASGHLLNTTMSGSKWMTGGTVGPEGSVVELIVVTATIGFLFLRFGRQPRRLTAPLS